MQFLPSSAEMSVLPLLLALWASSSEMSLGWAPTELTYFGHLQYAGHSALS